MKYHIRGKKSNFLQMIKLPWMWVDSNVRNLVPLSDWNTENEDAKAVAVKVIRSIVGGMDEEF